MKEFLFISGLPRSGSTLLSAILKQNPDFYADISSLTYSLCNVALGCISKSEHSPIIKEEKRKLILQGLFNSYYENIKNKVIFDTNRYWTSQTSLLKLLFPETKIICCVRDLIWIIDSLELITSKNILYKSSFANEESSETLLDRCDALMDLKRGGQVARPYYFLEEGLLLNPEMILLVEYEDLCKNTDDVLREIYDFIKKPYFKHDFKNIEYDNEEFDMSIGMLNLHKVKKEIKWEDRKSILPKSVWDKYAGKEFWRSSKNYYEKTIYNIKEVA